MSENIIIVNLETNDINEQNNHDQVNKQINSLVIHEESESEPESEQIIKVQVDTSVNEQFKNNGLEILVERFLDDGVIDNNELVEIIQVVIEIVERNRSLNGSEKKVLALLILRQFLESKMKNYNEIEKQISKSIDFAVKVSKEGFGEIKLVSTTITEVKTAFNLIYASTISKINDKYPLADDIINNIFDIIVYIMQLIEGQTMLNNNEKEIILKKIIVKTISSLEESTKITVNQKDFLLSQVDPTIAIAKIGIRAKNGAIQINPREIISIFQCFINLFQKCKPSQSTHHPVQ
jgi:hypothetical protein